MQAKMTHHLSRRILTQVSKEVKSKRSNLDKAESHEQRWAYIKERHGKHILNTLTGARKSRLGLKEHTVQRRELLPPQQPNAQKDTSATCSKTSAGAWRSVAVERTRWEALRFPLFDFPRRRQFHSPTPQSVAALGRPCTFPYPRSNWNSGLLGRGRQMSTSLHSRHNKAQSIA